MVYQSVQVVLVEHIHQDKEAVMEVIPSSILVVLNKDKELVVEEVDVMMHLHQ
tara:strand:- start:504 stop:662 length:159 start_codon:yes stop_codon:yes gene_type:complete